MTHSLAREIDRTAAWLASPGALAMIAEDPYWPKWDAPWWAMTLLWELGRAEAIPPATARAMVEALNRHYERDFPASEADLKPGKSIYRDYGCFCMVGTIMQVLGATGLEIDRESPWLREFLLRHHLADGGWNCDNGKTTSSFLSTVVSGEALLACTAREFTPAESAALDAAAEYLQRRSLCRSLSKNCVADATWLVPHFPRFYEYDTLRGLTFLARWSERRGRPLEADRIRDAVAGVDRFFAEGGAIHRAHLAIRTLRKDEAGVWGPGVIRSTPLIDLTADPEIGPARLRAEWSITRPVLIRRAGLSC